MAACYKLDLINVQYQSTLHINKTLHSKIQLITNSFVYRESVGCTGVPWKLYTAGHLEQLTLLKLLKTKIKTINFSLDVSSLLKKHWVIYFNNVNLLSLSHFV